MSVGELRYGRGYPMQAAEMRDWMALDQLRASEQKIALERAKKGMRAR